MNDQTSRTAAAPLEYASVSNPGGHRGQGFLAVAGTILLPGLGHAIARRPRRGLAWIAAHVLVGAALVLCAGLPTLVPALILLLPATIVVALWNWVDAYRIGRRATSPMLGRPWRRYVVGAVLIIIAAVVDPLAPLRNLISDHWVRSFAVNSRAMTPTLVPGDRFLVNLQLPVRRWDLAAFRPPYDPEVIFVMRIVALPGETVEIIGDELYINGQRAPRPDGLGPVAPVPQAPIPSVANGRPVTLRDDEYFVLGDNSTLAGDSRYWMGSEPGRQPGALPAENILGPAIAIYWPPARWRRLRE